MIIVPYTELKVGYAKVQNPDGYPNLLQKMWDRGETFIIVEQDVLVTKSQIDEIQQCPANWCAYGYNEEDDFYNPSGCVYLGCVKLGSKLIKALPDVWKDMSPRTWEFVDCHLTKCAREAGLEVHQHFPPVVNT